MSAVTDRVMAVYELIEETASRHNLPAHIVAGVVCTESGGRPSVGRYEPAYRWLVADALDNPPGDWRHISRATREQWQKTSWGPMQVMGAVALERGHTGLPTELCAWETGLEIGCRHLAWCAARRDGDIQAGLLRYNGGGDPGYPGKVMEWAGKFGG